MAEQKRSYPLNVVLTEYEYYQFVSMVKDRGGIVSWSLGDAVIMWIEATALGPILLDKNDTVIAGVKRAQEII